MKRTASAPLSADIEEDVKLPHSVSSSIFDSKAIFRQDRDACGLIKSQQPQPPHPEDALSAQLAARMNAMSYRDRVAMIEDIHGVTAASTETAADVRDKLAEMHARIRSLTARRAYDKAIFLNPAYVRDPEFGIKFLRADGYDVLKAARRMVKFFELKYELFGLDLLARDIRQDDLTEAAKRSLRAGYIQTTPHSDRAGRRIVMIRKHGYEGDWRSHFAKCLYAYMRVLSEDVEAQKKGFVIIDYRIGDDVLSHEWIDVVKRSVVFADAMPIKVCAVHTLYDQHSLHPALQLMQSCMHKSTQLRYRSHFGSYTECMYNLLGYGITPSMIPVYADGTVNNVDFKVRLDEAAKKERLFGKDTKIIVPQTKDVLLGRGRPYQYFQGNIFLAEVIERNRAQYGKATRLQKTDIARTIMEYIKLKRGGRFLKRISEDGSESSGSIDGCNGSVWEEVNDARAREKVSHGLRAPVRSELLLDEASDEYVGSRVRIFVPPDNSPPDSPAA